jgi:opacity protein-like surface antigen
MLMRGPLHVVLMSLFVIAVALPLGAQTVPGTRLRATGGAGVSLGDGSPSLALDAALSYDLTRLFAVEFDLMYARNLAFTLDLCPPPLVCILGGHMPVKGRTVALLASARLASPVWRRVRVYALAGAGAAHVRQRHASAPQAGGATTGSAPAGQVVVPIELTRSNLAPAFSGGGGVQVDLSPRCVIGVDVRSLHVRDEEATPARFIVPAGTLDTLRVGARVSWRF